MEYNLSLHGGFLCLGLLDLSNLGCGFGAKGTTSPVFSDLLSPLVVVGLDGFNKLRQRASVIGVNLQG